MDKMEEHMGLDEIAKDYIKLHPEANRYAMGRCQKCGLFYIPRLGHKCTDVSGNVKAYSPGSEEKICQIKSNIAVRATLMLREYTDRFRRLK